MTIADESAVSAAVPNTALRNRMQARGLSKIALARTAGVDERTIQRWLDGETKPQAAPARSVADALECEPGDLWPQHFSALATPQNGIVAVSTYASRAHVPIQLWVQLFREAAERIDICVYGGTFLFDTVPGFNRLMANAAGRGVAVRFLVGDPASAAVFQRGAEERIGHSLTSRCALTLDRLSPIAGHAGITIRTHATPLYVSIFRVDDTLIANHHIYGSPASDNPALIIEKAADPDLWEKYEASYELIWSASKPALHHLEGN